MDSVAVTVPLRPPTKKMKKRKELDALAAPHAITRRNSGKRSSQELLTDSSDDRSEYWSVSTRGGRKCRGSRRSRSCPGFLRACSAFLACSSVLVTATLIWLFIDVRQQLSALRTELDQVIAGNAILPDTLQKSHSLSRDLQHNQTNILANITDIKLQLANFTTQLSSIQHGLYDVQEKIKAAPELVNVPDKLKDLSTEVSSWGSKITDLQSTANTSKELNAQIQNVQKNILENITNTQLLLADLTSMRQQPEAVFSNKSEAQIESLRSTMDGLAANLTLVNTTLTRNITWLAEYQAKDYKRLDSLAETTQNISSKVISLDGECAKMTVQDSIKQAVDKLSADVKLAKNIEVDLMKQLKTLENEYNTLLNFTNTMFASLSELQNSRSNTTAQNTATIQSSIIPESAEVIPKDTGTEISSISIGETTGEDLQGHKSPTIKSEGGDAGTS